jgi:hypothetical protein
MRPCGTARAIRRARLWAQKRFSNVNHRRNVFLSCAVSGSIGMDRAHEVLGLYEKKYTVVFLVKFKVLTIERALRETAYSSSARIIFILMIYCILKFSPSELIDTAK